MTASGKRSAFAVAVAAACALTALRLSPGYVRSSARGLLYSSGFRGLNLDGTGRFAAAVAGRPDRVPCAAQMHEHVQTITGLDPGELFRKDGALMVDATAAVNEWYRMDLPLPLTDVYNFEAEALGAEVSYRDTGLPALDCTKPLINEPGDLELLARAFGPESGRIQYVIDATNRMKLACDMPKVIFFCAPFSLAVGLRSYQGLVVDMRRDPGFVHELLTLITEVVHPRYLKTVSEATGARFAMGSDAWAAYPNLTPEMIEKWVLPYNDRLRKRMIKEGIALVLAGAGDYCEQRVERFDRRTMETCWWLFTRSVLGRRAREGMAVMGMGKTEDWPLEWVDDYTRKNAKGIYGRRPVVAGISARLISEGPVESIVEFVRSVIDKLGREGKLVFWFAQIPARTPPQHVHAAVSALRVFGRYPIAEDLSRVRFEMAEFEPFGEWIRQTGYRLD